MTEFIVTATAPRQQLVADGATSLVSFPFALEASDQLRVFLDDAELLTGFTVTVEPAGAGGTVRFTSPPIEGTRVTLLRESAIARTSDFLTGGAFRAAASKAGLDCFVDSVGTYDPGTDPATLSCFVFDDGVC